MLCLLNEQECHQLKYVKLEALVLIVFTSNLMVVWVPSIGEEVAYIFGLSYIFPQEFVITYICLQCSKLDSCIVVLLHFIVHA